MVLDIIMGAVSIVGLVLYVLTVGFAIYVLIIDPIYRLFKRLTRWGKKNAGARPLKKKEGTAC